MIIDKGKLQELLIAHWTTLVDVRRFIAFVLETIRDHRNDLEVGLAEPGLKTSTQVTISRFELQTGGFAVWADFRTALEDGVAVGTSEFHLNGNGEFNHVRTVGDFFRLRPTS
jgi:hypothetical protein